MSPEADASAAETWAAGAGASQAALCRASTQPWSYAHGAAPLSLPLLLPQWGAAFRLAGDAAQRHRTWHYLEWREKEYDGRTEVEVVCPPAGDAGEPRRLRALTFIATSDK